MPVERVLPVCEDCMLAWESDDEECRRAKASPAYVVIEFPRFGPAVYPWPEGMVAGQHDLLTLEEAFRAAKLAARWDA